MKKSVPILVLLLSFSAAAFDECPGSTPSTHTSGHESSGGRPVPPSALKIHFGDEATDSKVYAALLQSITDSMRSGSLLKVLNRKGEVEGESIVCLQFDSVSKQTQAYIALFKSICAASDPLKPSPQFTSLGVCDETEFGL